MTKSNIVRAILKCSVMGFLFSCGLFSTTAVMAESKKLTITSEPVLAISVPSEVYINPTLSENFKTEDLTVNVSTNSRTGYVLNLSVPNTDMVSQESNVIPTLSSSTTAANFPDNKWGISLDSGNNFIGAPASESQIRTTSAPAGTSETLIKLGAKVTAAQASGRYATTLNFTAVANFVETSQTIETIHNMQDMTMAICAASEENETKQLKDNRDNKLYWVTKLADGNCWMTQNLDLGDNNMADMILTPEDSDVATNFTLTKPDTTISFDSSHYDVINYRDPGEQYYITSGTTANDTSYTSKSACESAKGAELCAHSHAGNYYNWYTATAGTGTQAMSTDGQEATSSICPKGWRLPTNNSDPGAKSYYNLLHNHDIISSGNNYTTNGFNNIRSNPLYFVRSGYYYTASLNDAANNGDYWSSTVYNSYYAHYLYFYSYSVYPQDDSVKYYGFSVRCLARNNPTNFTIKYDQNTTDTVTNLPPDQTLSNFDGETTPPMISSQVPNRDGYSFSGWATSKDGDVKYPAGAVAYVSSSDMSVNNTLILYAKWQDAPSLITFNISNQTYNAVQGSTWAEWVNSEYNTGFDTGMIVLPYSVVGNTISFTSGYVVGAVPSETIIPNHIYNYSTYGCLLPGTLITLADGNKKKIEDMTYDDKVLVWNFDEGHYDTASIAWLTQSDLYNNHYYKLTFSDGTVLKTTGTNSNHKVFNADEEYFQGVSSIEVGTHVYTENGIVTIVDKEYIEEDIEYYNLITTTHFNCFANGVLTSDRYNNMYNINNMKYVKDNRPIKPYFEFANRGIDYYWYDTLRLGEQSDSMDEIVDYIQKLESQMRER